MLNPRGRIGNPMHGARIFTHTFYKLPAKTYSPVSDLNQKQNKKRNETKANPATHWKCNVECTPWIHLNKNESKELIGNPCLIAGMWWKSNKTKSSITWHTGWGFSLRENGVVQCDSSSHVGVVLSKCTNNCTYIFHILRLIHKVHSIIRLSACSLRAHLSHWLEKHRKKIFIIYNKTNDDWEIQLE